MKKIVMAAIVLSMCLALAGCSKKENPVTGYKSGDVTLGQYKGLSYTKLSTEVTEADIDDDIEADLNSHAEKVEVTDRAVQEGDIVDIDYVGKIDGVEFDRGSGNAPNLQIGSGVMIPGFEEGIIGMSKGEKKTIDVTFPETYTNDPEKAGKAATFDITVNSISENVVPILNDDFIKNTMKYDSLEAYRAAVRSELEKEAEENAESRKFNDVIGAAVDNSTFNRDLKEEITKAKANLIANYDAMAQGYYNTDAKTLFAAMYGMTDEQFEQTMENQATSNTKYNFMLSAIVEAEKITATDAEVTEYAQSLMSEYGVSSVEELYKMIKDNSGIDGKTMITEQVKLNKASDLIVDSAVEAQ